MIASDQKPNLSKSKKYLYIIIGIILFLLVLSAWLPKQITVSKSIETTTDKSFVQNVVSDISSYSSWYPKCVDDSLFFDASMVNMIARINQNNYHSTSYGEGNVKIESLKGDTIMIIDSTESDNIVHKIICTQGDKNSITVTSSKHTGFLSNLLNLFHKSTLGSYSQKMIKNLDNECKKRSDESMYYGLKLENVSLYKKYFSSMRAEVMPENITSFYGQNIAALFQQMQGAGIVTNGNPHILYYTNPLTTNKIDLGVAISSFSNQNVMNTESVTIDSSIVVRTTYNGPRNKNQKAIKAIQDYIKDRKLHIKFPILEEFKTDPSQEPDPYKWETNVYGYYTK
jgi:effector-binding domain-containing protein